jgi:hypothetical protein
LAARNELLSLNNGDTYTPLSPAFPHREYAEKGLEVLQRYHLSLFRNVRNGGGPRVINARAEPETVFAGDRASVLLTACVFDPDGDFSKSGDLVVDIKWNVFRYQKMYDDGTHGDALALDGTYSYLATIPKSISDSPKVLVITATDAAKNTGQATVNVNVVDPNAIYVDDADAEFTCSDWHYLSGPGCASEGYSQSYHYHMSGDGSCAAKWKPVIPEDGDYSVYAWWTTDCLERATNAKFTIHHDGRAHSKRVNQQVISRRWHYLGTYHLRSGKSDHVLLSDDADGTVIADAIKLKLDFTDRR